MDGMFSDLATIARDFWGVWLMACFLLVLVYALHPARRDAMKRYGAIPLRDDDEAGSRRAVKDPVDAN